MTPRIWTFAGTVAFLALIAVATPGCKSTTGCTCFGDGLCVCPDHCTDASGATVCCPGSCGADGGDTNPGDGDTNPSDGDNGGDSTPPPDANCHCTPTADDQDGDCIPDLVELHGNNPTSVDPTLILHPILNIMVPRGWDTDLDGVGDGCEDANHNGNFDPGEMNPNSADTDGDGIPDGVEDANHNGKRDIPEETSAVSADTDADGIPDGLEDRNHNGKVDPWIPFDPTTDLNMNGCWDAGEPGESDPRLPDSDGDGIPDRIEDKNHNGLCDPGETCAFIADTDCDGLIDGNEDKNHDGVFGRGETDPLNPDTDGDGIPDGIEDANGDGIYDPITETDPLNPDSDGDGIPDGVEDKNHNGIVDPCVMTGHDGTCWAFTDAECETDPRLVDSDHDGIPDGVEDANHDGHCETAFVPARDGSGTLVQVFVETCAFLADTDCDGLPDGIEDRNHSGGPPDPGETDPRNPDSDLDGLYDGCLAWMNGMCEDKNNDGIVAAVQDFNNNGHHDPGEPGETDPLVYDTDRDGLGDGCELNFATHYAADGVTIVASGPLDPLNPDTDGDGIPDGDEDKNHNCQWDPGETDPRVFDAAPPPDTKEAAQFRVCGAENLKQLTWARTTRLELDYQLALEVERDADTGVQSKYYVNAFGKNLPTSTFPTEFRADDLGDVLWGHVFQSDKLTDQSGTLVSRMVYGFLIASEDTRELDTALDGVRDTLALAFPDLSAPLPGDNSLKGLEETGALTARPAHDDLPAFPVLHAQRQYRVRLGSAVTSMELRTKLLGQVFLGNQAVDPPNLFDLADANGAEPTYQMFTMYVGAVQRAKQKGPVYGEPVILTVVVFTPETSDPSVTTLPLSDRVARLEDLTGGSALSRSENTYSNACELKNAKKADADLLWVVDDSSSMQTLINRLQTAATEQHAVLSANTNVVDFRVGMTTTNASPNARTRCYATPGGTSCDSACTSTTIGSTCTSSCADQWLGCVYVCPAGCGTNCDATGWCDCGAACAAACGPSGRCVDPTAIPAGLVSAPLDHPMPGGGGTFYYEDGELLDCNSASTTNQDKFINYCGLQTPYGTEFAAFLGASTTCTAGAACYAPKALTADAGFLSADNSANCATALMDLRSDASTGSTCTPTDPSCCKRLIDACTDGPTVLESEMCDLIRAMGGLLPLDADASGFSGRAHAASEQGSRQARRLLTTMLPALPRNYSGPLDARQHLRLECCSTCDPTDAGCAATCCNSCDPLTCPTTNPHCCSNESLGLDCNIDASCQPCVPGVDPYCPTTPLVTLFLSDEEDYWFKDECYVSPASGVPSVDDVDKSPLPDLCRYADGNAATLEPCTETYCDAQGYVRDVPAGYNPNLTGYNVAAGRSGTLKMRPACFLNTNQTQGACTLVPGCVWNATATRCEEDLPKACSPYPEDLATSCVGDPCPSFQDQAHCEAPALATFFADSKFDGLRSGIPDNRLCVWQGAGGSPTNGVCRNACNDYTKLLSTSTQPEYDTAAAQCALDARCRWNQSELSTVVGDLRRSCELAVEPNDCRACKRLKRLDESIYGEAGAAARCQAYATEAGCELDVSCRWTGTACTYLAGLGAAGPVYSITRNAGQPGTSKWFDGRPITGDECGGAWSTWGRGDGAAYRELAIATQGRTQNVCSSTYKDFMQLLITDIVALSKPYPLQGKPIAATIKVGLARPNSDGTSWTPYDVPRSLSRGFLYNSTSNSLGFKNDPIDGECAYDPAHGTCSANGVIEPSEIASAQNVPFMPHQGDIVIVSYRFWLPVPCRDLCTAGTTCTRVLCEALTSAEQPDCTTSNDCPDINDVCTAGKCTCTTGDVIDRCRTEACGPCQVLTVDPDPPYATHCVQQPHEPGTCDCTTETGSPCTPGGPNVCPYGQYCDETGCHCIAVDACPGVSFDSQGYFPITGGCSPLSTCAECQAAIGCCAQWQGDATYCDAYTAEAACPSSRCVWTSVTNRCIPAGVPQPCCNVGETPSCFLDPQSGKASIVCKAAQCSCHDFKTCQQGCETLDVATCQATAGCSLTGSKCYATACQSWQTCNSGSECTPACQPVVQFCDTLSGCVCAANPG